MTLQVVCSQPHRVHVYSCVYVYLDIWGEICIADKQGIKSGRSLHVYITVQGTIGLRKGIGKKERATFLLKGVELSRLFFMYCSDVYIVNIILSL